VSSIGNDGATDDETDGMGGCRGIAQSRLGAKGSQSIEHDAFVRDGG
jgi:hypothetical protein